MVEQNLKTMTRAKTLSLDAKTGRILLIAAEYAPPPSPPPAPDPTKKGGGRSRGGPMVPDSFTVLVVGR